MPGVRAAAAAEHSDRGQSVTQCGVPGAEVDRITLVEFGRLVELGVASHGRVRPQADEPSPPSGLTRSLPTPPTPISSKPLSQSKSFVATAAAGVTTAAVAIGEVSRAVSPYAGQSDLVARAVSALALVAAMLAAAAVVFVWLKGRRA